MTAAAIQALIDAARTGAGDLVTWAELKAILEGLKDQDAVYTFNSRQGTVLPLEGDYSLNLLSDVIVNTPITNQVLQYNGTNWVNATAPATTVSSVFGRTGTITAAEGDYSLTQLSDVTISSPVLNQLLVYNGSIWTNTTLSALTTTIYSGDGQLASNRIIDLSTYTLNFSSSTNSRLFIDTNGRIGVNTISPSALFSIGTGSGEVGFIGGLSSPNRARLFYDTDNSGWNFDIGKLVSGVFTEQITLKDNGNVGIDTATPNAKLEVSGVARFTGTNGFSIGNDAVQNRIQYSSDWTRFSLLTSADVYAGFSAGRASIGSTYANSASPTNGMIIEGDVGIGTNVTSDKLHVVGNIRASGDVLSFSNIIVRKDGLKGLVLRNQDITNRWYVYSDNATETGSNVGSDFNIARYSDAGSLLSTPFFIKRSTGFVGINQQLPGYNLDVSGDGRFSSNLRVGSTTANCSHILSSGSESLAWTASNFAISSAIPIRTVIVNPNGTYTSLTGTRNTFVGYRAGSNVTTGSSNTFIGNDAGLGVTTGGGNVVITTQGATTTGLPATTSNSITLASEYRFLDASTMPTSNYAFIGGGYDAGTSIRNFYFGQMPFTPEAGNANTHISFFAPSGSGTNIAGCNFTINAGRGTGNATAGDFIIGTSTATGSGTTLQTLTNRVWVKGGTGRVGINQSNPGYDLDVNGSANFTSFLSGKSDVSHSVVSITNGDYGFKTLKTYTPTSTQNNLNSYGAVIQTTWNLTSGTYTGTSSYNTAGILSQVTIAGNATTTATQPFRGILSGLVGLPASTAMNISNFSYYEARKPDDGGVTGHVVQTIYGLYIESLKGTANYTITNGWGIYQEGISDNNYFSGKVLIGTSSVGSSPLRINGLPTSATGLSTGDLWNDSGTLKIA